MKLAQIIRKRRAVSPVLAAILLIGLAVAAAAALFFVVIPLVTTSTKVAFEGTPTFTNGTAIINGSAKMQLKSTGTKAATITDIKIDAYTDTWTPASFDFTETTIEAGQGATLTYNFDAEIDQTTYPITKWRVTVTYKSADDTSATPTEYTLGPREFNP